MAISSIGIGSGLKLDELLEDLRKAENVSLTAIQNRQVENVNRISAYGKLKASITALQSAGKTLNDPSLYGAVKVKAAGDGISVTGNNKATPGQYSIAVEQLASKHSLSTGRVSDRSTPLGVDGKVIITLQNGTAHTLDLTGKDTSLQGVMQAVNADPKLGVTATIINNGDPDHPYQLVLTASETGEQASIKSLSVDGNANLDGLLSFTAATESSTAQGMKQLNEAVNAKATINGIDIISQSNTLKDTVEGLEITLNKASSETISLDVTRDDSIPTKAITDFIEAYNALNSTIRSLTSYDVENKKGSALTGDSMPRRIQSSLRSSLNIPTTEGSLRSLASIGITTDPKTGDLVVDDKKLATALKENMADVQRLFAGEDAIGNRINKAADEYVKKGGFIDNATDGADKIGKTLEKQALATAERIDNKIEAYRKQFIQLDRMVNQMKGTSDYLTQQLSMLGNMNSNK
ncbi:flagellar hook-associated protein 2 [Alcaligenes faecalis]|jgi:flagellar hook-associated protein 2|uniref:flagellar filament capping protein FliD n=1 Tax=Alcaligenes faecalis TaxID=511 RepID=UPI0019323452|nr:flagellar filament capping protein FliD [Alcaligenes faecalis]QRF91303.1 flagellar hook-associated protein 2 [Alcaligenes faecalis]